MTYPSYESCNDDWQRQLYKAGFEEGIKSFKNTIARIHFMVPFEDTSRCAEDTQIWPCETICSFEGEH